MTIHKSLLPDVPVELESTYTQVFRSNKLNISQDATMFIDAYTGKTVKYGDMFHLTRRLAWGLRNEFQKLGGVSLERGDAIMLLSPNSVAWPVILYGCIAAGIRCSPANPAYTAYELLYQYENSGSKTIIVHPQSISVVLKIFELQKLSDADARRRMIVADLWTQMDVPNGFVKLSELMDKGIIEREEPFYGQLANETALMCYSSGTTGKPKGVEITHKNLNAMVHFSVFPMISPSKGDAVLGFLPFFHIFGIIALVHTPFITGAPVVIMSRFDMEDFCKFVEQYKITTTAVVPPVCIALARHPAVSKYNMKTLKYLVSGAAPLPAPVIIATRDKLRSVGTEIFLFQGYGLTEAVSTVARLPYEDYDYSMTKVGSVGLLAPNWELRLVIDGERDAGAGERGEIWIRGPAMMKGYLNNKEATENTITKDGWLKTGDIGVRDSDGYLFIVDRMKELIKYNGFQVAPAELEEVLLSHSDIVDAGVVGVQSNGNEVPRAYVVRKNGLPKTPEEGKAWITGIHQWFSSRVVKHKYLRGGIVIVEAVPKSTSGKILRQKLKTIAETETSAENNIGSKL